MDASGILYATCQRLKAECGRPESFQYDEMQLQVQNLGEIGRLTSLCNEQMRQIEVLAYPC
jgi:hypothetical protein